MHSPESGMGTVMTASPENRDRDVAIVIDLLRRRGPRSLSQLCDALRGDSWSNERVEHAVIEAWSGNRLSVDRDDRLVAL
jgi:hypothetical protein